MAQARDSSIVIGGDELQSFFWFEITEDITDLHEFSLACPRRAIIALGSGNNQQGWNVNEKIGSTITFNISAIETRLSGSRDFQYKGIITSISAYRNPGNNNEEDVLIEGSGMDILLNDFPNCASYENKTIGNIVDQIIQLYPQDMISRASATIRDTTSYPYIVQYRETNIEFLRRLLRNFGMFAYYDGQKLVCGHPDQTTDQRGIFGLNVSKIKIRSSIRPLNFRTKYHDFVHDTTVTGEASSVSLDSFVGNAGRNALNRSLSIYPQDREGFYNYYNSYNVQPDPVNDKISLQKKIHATSLISITGDSISPIHIGNVLHVFPRHQSVNDQASVDMGEYLITKVKHSFDGGTRSYTNNFEGIPHEMDLISGDNGVHAPYCPVQNAVVTDNNDPEKLGRVKVHFDWQADGQSTPFIRMISAHSGDSRGFYFIPEVGDEVVVGFEHNHPQKPYVLGSMFGGNHAPGQDWVTRSNNIKKIRTRQGHTIEFDDSSGIERMAIYNGSGNSAGVSSNRIILSLSPDKITIHSEGNIEINGDSLDIHARSDLNIHSDLGDVNINGNKVSIHADGDFKAEGINAEIDGIAQVKIQAAIVQIN